MQGTQAMPKPSTRGQAPTRKSDVLRIAAKPPSLQPTAQLANIPRKSAKLPAICKHYQQSWSISLQGVPMKLSLVCKVMCHNQNLSSRMKTCL